MSESVTKTVIQGVMVTVLSSVLLGVGSMVSGKLDKLNNKLELIEKHQEAILAIQQQNRHFDSLFTMQAFLNDNRQKGEWELDTKTDKIMLEMENLKSNQDILFAYVRPK